MNITHAAANSIHPSIQPAGTPPNQLLLDDIDEPAAQLLFEIQPLMNMSDGSTYGYELFYRGARPLNWTKVDLCVLSYLAINKGKLPVLFVNLSNEILLTQPVELFIEAARGNQIVFEVSESYSDAESFRFITDKINLLSTHGVQFAIDDFGSGQDGLKRLYSLDQCSNVKIDGNFLHMAMARDDAATMLRYLVHEWRSRKIITIAECVESPEILKFAADVGFDVVQGWHVDAILMGVE